MSDSESVALPEDVASLSWNRAVLWVTPLCWMLAGALQTASMEAWRALNQQAAIAGAGTRLLSFLLLVPVVMAACRLAVRVGMSRRGLWWRIALQLFFCLFVASLGRAAFLLALGIADPATSSHEVWMSVPDPMQIGLFAWAATGATTALAYVLTLGVTVGVKNHFDLEGERVRRADMQRQATEARLRALSNQLNPHFLFNVLNSIVSLIATDPRLAQNMVTRVADLLRRILQESATRFVTLRSELDLVEHYLEIQGMRFGSRLSHEVRADAAAQSTLVPSLILQPIIENAVIHGLKRDQVVVNVQIDAERIDGLLRLIVANPGPVVAKPVPGGGLGNVMERLDTLYGGRASVRLEVREPGEFVTILEMPAFTRDEAT